MKLGISTPDDLQWISLSEGTLILGRSGSCSIRLSDPVLSRQHCAITRDGDRVTCSDLGSSNGTYHEGALIERFDLEHGSVIELGDSALMLVSSSDRLPGTQAPPRSPARIQALVESRPELENSAMETDPGLFGWNLEKSGLLQEVIVDRVITELMTILTHSDPEFRSMLTRTIDRAISQQVIESSADLEELRAEIRKILEKERS